jgi:RsiW-degrading membrane proteinase PrsW (M82 family)
MSEWPKIAVSLIPVFVFLAGLIFLDSYKLVRFRAVLTAIGAGAVAAIIGLLLNRWLMQMWPVSTTVFSRYAAPLVEETLKALYLVYLLKSKRVGFMVDAAICGFAVGAGFSLLENIYYLHAVGKPDILIWIVRGLGTAAMHGTTTALFGILAKATADRRSSMGIAVLIPGFTLAVGVHSLYNHFIIPPVPATLLLLTILPLMIIVVFQRSERATRIWLGKGMDADMELLDLIVSDRIAATPVGVYLQTLKDKFPGTMVADMLCLLRIHCELALGAKGVLLMREAGIKPPVNPEIIAKFRELRFLEKSLGKTGRLAMAPFLKTSRRDLWQLYMIGR